jgi:two-component system OmpR family response regulator
MSMDIGHVVILDSDAVTRNMLARYLTDNKVPAKATSSEAELNHILFSADPSLIVLNLRHGPDNGFDILRDLRSRSDVPIIVTTGDCLDQADCIIGLELGADDYILKPVNPRVLLARVRAVLRRFHMGRVERPFDSEEGDYCFDGWRVECRCRRLLNPDGVPVPLTKNEYALLLAFLRAPQRPLTRQHLLQATRIHQEGDTCCVNTQILRLRRKFKINSSAPGFIRTEHGIGYTFAVAVVPPFPTRV